MSARTRSLNLLKTLALAALLAAGQGWSAFASPRVLQTVHLKQGAVLDHPIGIAVDPQDGSVFTAGYDSGNVLKLNPATKAVLAQRGDMMYPGVVKFFNNKVYVSGYDLSWAAKIFIYNASDLSPAGEIPSQNYWVNSFAIDPVARKLYYGTWGKAYVVNLADNSQQLFANFGEYSEWDKSVANVTLDSARPRVYLTVYSRNAATSEVVSVDADNKQILARISIGRNPAYYDDRYDADLDGDRLFVTQMYSSSITVVDVVSNAVLRDIPDISWPQKLVIDRGRHRLYVADNYTDKLHILDTLTFERIRSLSPGDDPSGVCVDPGRARAYTANVWTQDVGVVDTDQEKVIDHLAFAPASPLDAEVDGDKAYVSNGPNGGVFVLDAASGRLLDKINFYAYADVGGFFEGPASFLNLSIGEMRLAPAGGGDRLAYAVDEFNQAIAVLNLTQGKFVKHLSVDGAPTGLALNGGQILFPYISNGQLYLGTSDGSTVGSILIGPSEQSQGVGVNASTRKAYVADYANHRVAVVDLDRRSLLKTVDVGRYPAGMAVDATNNKIYVSNYGSDSVSVIDGAVDAVAATLPAGRAPWGLKVNVSARRLYVAGTADGILSVINLKTGRADGSAAVGSGAKFCALDPASGRMIAPAQNAGTVTVLQDDADLTPPDIRCPAPVEVETTDVSGARVVFATPTVTDNVDPNPSVAISPASGSRFAVGATTVTIRAEDASGNESFCFMKVSVRLRVCPRPVGDLAAVPMPHKKIQLSWSPSATGGVTAYRVYMGADSINYSQAAAVLGPTATSWTAENLTAGAQYRFVVRAQHGSGCEETNTNAVAATAFDTPPCLSARIKSPNNGRKISGERVTVTAETLCEGDRDVKSVRFEYKPNGDNSWRLVPAANHEHPNPDASSPYFVHWDVSDLADGEYHIRAVAQDGLGGSDPSPASITVLIDHSDPDSSEREGENGHVEKVEKVENQKSNVVVISDSRLPTAAQVQIPAGALSQQETKVTVQLNPPSVPPAAGEFKSAGTHIDIELHNGQSRLESNATLILPYPDQDDDGKVDGAAIEAKDLKVCYYNPKKAKWEVMPGSKVDKDKKTVSAQTSHFSLFGLFAADEADASFRLGAIYAFPNPARGGRNPVIHVESGLADSVDLRFYDLSGHLVHSVTLTERPGVIAERYAYEYAWDAGGVASGVYVVAVTVYKQGENPMKKLVKVAVIK